MTDFDDELEAAEHASCQLFDDDFPPWRVGRLIWGFPLDPKPQMTLVVAKGLLLRHVRILLEDDIGNRAFMIHGPLPERLRGPLHAWVTAHRDELEEAWIRIMLTKGWLTVRTHGRTVDVVAYEGTSNMIQRVVDCSNCPAWIEDSDISVRDGHLILGVDNPPRAQVHHRLGRIIWTGADDGNDAGSIPF